MGLSLRVPGDRMPISTESNEISEQVIKTSASISPYGTAEAQDQRQLNGEGKAPLTNPLAFHTYDFVPSVTGHIRKSILSRLRS
jgi:hypothetical protein